MDRFGAPRNAHAIAALLVAGPLLAVLVVALAIPPLDLAAAGVAWVAPSLAVLLVAVAIGAALAHLVAGLRDGGLAALLVAASAAAVGGGAVALLADARIDLPLVAAAACLLGAAIADRSELRVARQGYRVAIAIGSVALAEGAAVAELLPAFTAQLDAARPWPAAVAVTLTALAGIAGIGRPVASIAAALVVGGAAAASGGGGLSVIVGLAALVGSQVIALLASAPDFHDVERPGEDLQLLPPLAARLADAVLRFDGRLRLRDWNPTAAALLGLDTGSHDARLEDLLGVSMGELPGAEGATVSSSGIGGLDIALHRLGGGITAVIRDPGTSPESERLARELRGTIEELLQARRTIDLQRREIERSSTVDPLTGVTSRSAVMDRLGNEVAQARRYQHPVAVVVLDVDGFGEVNRTRGLAGGDAALREVALRMRLRIREADDLGRIGSDSFIAILPHTDGDGAATFADAVRHRLSLRPVSIGESEVRLTASIGVAVMRPGEDLDVDGLLARAHEALDSARRAGGDRIALDRLHGLARLEERREPHLRAIDAEGETEAEDH